MAIGTASLVWLGFNVGDSLFECASAQGNVGLSVGIVSGSLSVAAQLVLIIEMWIGRLEVFPVIILMLSLGSSVRMIPRKVNLYWSNRTRSQAET